MSIIMIILFLMCSVGMKFAPENTYHNNYILISKTTAVKGIFVILVFFRHYAQYVNLVSDYDKMFNIFNRYIGQLLVTMFLFYSGYGVMESIKKKENYIKTIPFNRVLKVWFHFDIVIILFLVTNWVLGNKVSFKKFGLSLIGWDTIGNSNWYIVAMVLLYLITFVSFLFCGKKFYLGVCICTSLSVLFIPYIPIDQITGIIQLFVIH